MGARWQKGSLRLEGKHTKVWVGRFLADEIVNGQVKRIQKSVRLGTKEQFATERLARRELQKLIDPINDKSYRPKNRITFKDFAEKWERDVLAGFKPAGVASTKSDIRILNKWFADVELPDITNEKLQRWISARAGEWTTKTISNKLTTLQRLWKKAKAWKYVSGDSPFEGLDLPAAEQSEKFVFSPAQVQEILSRAEEPFRTMFWICAETGLRGGELCGLFKTDIDLDGRHIFVRRSAFQGKLQTPKTGNAVRAFDISTQLAEHLRAVLANGGPTNITGPSNITDSVQSSGPGRGTKTQCAHTTAPLLFVTPRGCPYDNGNIVKRAFKPILRAMGIDSPRIGLHSLRHTNASAMDSLQVPMQVRMDRLGHGSEKMTMRYTHSNSQDHRVVADALGALFAPSKVTAIDKHKSFGASGD